MKAPKNSVHLEDVIGEDDLRRALCPHCNRLLELITEAEEPEILICLKCEIAWELSERTKEYNVEMLDREMYEAYGFEDYKYVPIPKGKETTVCPNCKTKLEVKHE